MPESEARRERNSQPYCDESQRGYRVRAACIAAKYSRATGINLNHYPPTTLRVLGPGIDRVKPSQTEGEP